MKIAVVSDIHGNLEALKAVLADMDGRADEVVSLGDSVGYGPDPEAVVQLLRERNIPSVAGNHELGLLRSELLGRFNPSARLSVEITRNHLSKEALRTIAEFPRFIVREGCRFVHGMPPDSAFRYLFSVSDPELRALFGSIEESVCFVGHTHDLELVFPQDEAIVREPLTRGRHLLGPERPWIVNAGSVGQPRDGNNNAKYGIFDTEARLLDVRFVSYDIARTVDKILKMGLPTVNAHRLW